LGEVTDIGATEIPSGLPILETFHAADQQGKPAILNQQIVDQIKSGELKLAIYGEANYTDDFFLSKQAEFCYVYAPEYSDDRGRTAFSTCPRRVNRK
jgi:hypothetical protein